ncbi:hypothetical protein CLAIMM_03738 [Cladophialophora immunda]|nr:hypothetical protein CLAIMM_03738 [Cladophialophora immunda]
MLHTWTLPSLPLQRDCIVVGMFDDFVGAPSLKNRACSGGGLLLSVAFDVAVKEFSGPLSPNLLAMQSFSSHFSAGSKFLETEGRCPGGDDHIMPLNQEGAQVGASPE